MIYFLIAYDVHMTTIKMFIINHVNGKLHIR